VRGLDYYTGTIFELRGEGGTLGSQNAICGGGRYDGLIEQIGGKPTPAVGFGLGIERLLLLIQELGLPEPEGGPQVYAVLPSTAALARVAALLEQLRAQLPTLSWIEDSTASAEELIRRVAAGEIDYTIADSHLFAVLRHFYPDLRVAFSLGPENQVAWALPRGEDSLRDSIGATSGRDRGHGRARQDSRSLLLRVTRVRLRRLARVHNARQHALAALP